MLKDLSEGSLEKEKQALCASMLSILSNVHDELIISTTKGAERFGYSLQEEMSCLMKTSDMVTMENSTENLTIITNCLDSSEKIKGWLGPFTCGPESHVKTAALEAYGLVEINEKFIKMIEKEIKKYGDCAKEKLNPEGTTWIEGYSKQIQRYENAMELLRTNTTSNP